MTPTSENSSSKKTVGRPREFNREAALESAMLIFWKKGFEGTSLADLTEAMGISKPSLYAAFESKEGLWREVVQTYIGQYGAMYVAALALPTVREVAEAWLRLTGGVREQKGVPAGCLVVHGALAGASATQDIQSELAAVRIGSTHALQERFERAKKEGDIPGLWEPASLAQYLTALVSGLAVQSVSGVSRVVLNQVVDGIMANWPDARG